jgi:hypothetical protein
MSEEQPCGCPASFRPRSEAGHLRYHALVTEQTGIPWGDPVDAQSLQAARGMKTPAPDMHSIAERNERQGKSSPGWRRRAA